MVLHGGHRIARKRQRKRAGERGERGDETGWAGRDWERLLSGVDESEKTTPCADGGLIDINISTHINQGEGARAATHPIPSILWRYHKRGSLRFPGDQRPVTRGLNRPSRTKCPTLTLPLLELVQKPPEPVPHLALPLGGGRRHLDQTDVVRLANRIAVCRLDVYRTVRVGLACEHNHGETVQG